jgi:hypothetical protein
MDDPDAFGQQTREILAAVGWHTDRVVDTARWEAELLADGFPPLHPAALRFLGEFGGIDVPAGGPGVTRARESFTIEPALCIGEADRFIQLGESIRRAIAPIGELAGETCACAFLGIDEQQALYVVNSRLATFGRMPQAMDRLALGYMPQRIG